MRPDRVKVSADLLLHSRLSLSAKLVAIFLQLVGDSQPAHAQPESGARTPTPPAPTARTPPTPAPVARASRQPAPAASTPPTLAPVAKASRQPAPGFVEACGLDERTVVRALAELECTAISGPANAVSQPPSRPALIPVDILLDKRIGIGAQLMYGMLQLVPGYRRSQGQITVKDLSCLAGVSVNAVKRAIRALEETGWLSTSQRNKHAPIEFNLRNPPADERDHALSQVKVRLQEWSFKGEAIMREYLSLIVDNDHYEDNATPGFLINPLTGHEMQFDRYYPPDVAFEYHGSQHFGPTPKYPSEIAARKQQARDYMKLGICTERGIRLVVVQAKDLTYQTLRQRVDGLLPLRSVDGHGRIRAYLDLISRSYRDEARTNERHRPT